MLERAELDASSSRIIMQSIANISAPEAFAGHVFDSRYHAEALLEQSSFGCVYRARDLALGETVCIELLPRSLVGSNHAWAMARSGLRRLAVLHHARIVEIYGLGVFSEGMPFVISEHVASTPLRALLRQGALPLERVLGLGRQLCEAIGAAHRASVLHGALEPAHVSVIDAAGMDERIKLRGFALATCLASRRVDPHGGVAPAHHYLSPEHVHRHVLDARSDVYALGALLYELATGSPPFSGRDAGELLCQHLDDEPEPASARLCAPSLALRVFDKIVLRCLAKRPEQRYPSMLELQHDLTRLASALAARAAVAALPRTPERARPTLCVHTPAPASRVQQRRPLPKVIIRDAAR
jgi:eukaryotic-like serine/threonine-protein kinase